MLHCRYTHTLMESIRDHMSREMPWQCLCRFFSRKIHMINTCYPKLNQMLTKKCKTNLNHLQTHNQIDQAKRCHAYRSTIRKYGCNLQCCIIFIFFLSPFAKFRRQLENKSKSPSLAVRPSVENLVFEGHNLFLNRVC